MKILVQQAQFLDFVGISNILPSPSFMEVDLGEGYLLGNRSDFYVARIHRDIVGFAQILKHNNEAELARLYVLPGYHRQGIGTLLVKKCFAVLIKGTRLTVKVEKNNLGAIIFYEICGFKKVREIKNILGENLLELWSYA